jgi:hypothetical protein
MNTSATTNVTTSARLRVKLAGGAAGLAMAGVLLAACSATSAGAAKSATSSGAGQYRQAVYGAPAARKLSEQEQLRAEHAFLLPAKPKLAGNAGDDPETLRKEHLAR